MPPLRLDRVTRKVVDGTGDGVTSPRTPTRRRRRARRRGPLGGRCSSRSRRRIEARCHREPPTLGALEVRVGLSRARNGGNARFQILYLYVVNPFKSYHRMVKTSQCSVGKRNFPPSLLTFPCTLGGLVLHIVYTQRGRYYTGTQHEEHPSVPVC